MKCTSEGPSTLEMAKNLGKAVVNHTLNAGKNVSEEDYKKRLEICGGCQFHKDGRCLHKSCGCFLKRKAWWESEKCPIGKWEEGGV